jgi:hypothetical protein
VTVRLPAERLQTAAAAPEPGRAPVHAHVQAAAPEA